MPTIFRSTRVALCWVQRNSFLSVAVGSHTVQLYCNSWRWWTEQETWDTFYSCSSWRLKEKYWAWVSHFAEVFSKYWILCTRPFSDPPSTQGMSEGWRQQGRYVKTRLEKISFIVVESHDFPPHHTHLHPIRCIDTYDIFSWITLSCLPLITRYQNTKSGQYRT